MLPGPPVELKPMFVDAVLPRLRQRWPSEQRAVTLRVCGIPEPTVAEAVERAAAASPGVAPAYCARPGMVDVHLTAAPAAEAALAAAEAQVRLAFGDAILPPACHSVVEAIAERLRQRGWGLATAESCTGGALGAALTDRAGASEFFRGAVVAYANEWKTAILGVRPETLARHGAVSAATATEMLDGLLCQPGVDAGIAITGIAGPGGGTVDKPVGLVFVATGVRQRRQVQRCVFPGSRDTVRQRAAAAALNQLYFDLLQYQA
jgi:nicotinamide-nucleotide amidase